MSVLRLSLVVCFLCHLAVICSKSVQGKNNCNTNTNTNTKTNTKTRTKRRYSEGHLVASNEETDTIFARIDPNTKEKVLTYYGLMVAGAVARSVSATAVHPLNVMKTMLQTRESKMPELTWKALSAGAGSQFIMSVPHGALSFAATETTKKYLAVLATNSTMFAAVPRQMLNPLLDFLSSSISTFICSIVSTPQMVLSDRIMAGIHPNFLVALAAIYREEGFMGFYRGWFPALVQKIPSYAMTWMFFQQLKMMFLRWMQRAGTTLENTLLGSVAAAGACCVMIPVDTVKTRLVTQRPGSVQHYTGMIDCFHKIINEEGVKSLYKALPPRLTSVVPMIGIQFGVYEFMKRLLIGLPPPIPQQKRPKEVPRIVTGST